MNIVIYADFESILMPCNTCGKQNETNKSINKQCSMWLFNKCCRQSLKKSKTSKQTYYRGDDAAAKFCKEIRAIAFKKISFCKRQMIELTVEEQKEYENATIWG